MVQTWPTEQCPKCREATSVELVPGERLCLHCRHEWEPAKTFGPIEEPAPGGAGFLASEPGAPTSDATGALVTIDAPPLAAVPDQPQDYPADDLYAQAVHARSVFLGAVVSCHALGVQGVVTEISDDGWAIIDLGNEYEVIVGPDEFDPVNLDVIPDETIAAIVTTDLAVAAQIIRAGAETLTESDGARRLTLAPDGFLPDDPDVMPVIEHGASYAIAVIATTCGIPTEQLRSIATMLETAAQAAER